MLEGMDDTAVSATSVSELTRPRPVLLKYYLLASLAAGPAFPIVFALRYFRFRTLRYRFDEEGVSMSWGILFRREIHLTYGRIQDIHLSSNFVERWLDLARIEIQTASGSAKAEMTIEGFPEFVALRDFLYGRMGGGAELVKTPSSSGLDGGPSGSGDDLASILTQTALELREIGRRLEASKAEPGKHDR